MIQTALKRFVQARFYLLPCYLATYYLQRAIDPSGLSPMRVRVVLLCLLGVLTLLALFACSRWLPDYKSRIRAGLQEIRKHDIRTTDELALEQHRWAGAQLVAIILLILGVASKLPDAASLPRSHLIPTLISALVVLVALFDAALDLSAEQTMCLLTPRRFDSGRAFNSVLWHTNQSNVNQDALFQSVLDATSDDVPTPAVSSTARNLIAFAILAVLALGSTIVLLLYVEYREVTMGF